LDEKTYPKEPGPEAVLEPDLPICDAHHHLWEYPGNVYLGKDLIADIDGHNIVQTVVVEAWGRNLRSGGKMKEPAEETALAVAESNSNPGRTRIASGIIGYADLMAGKAVENVIESHIIAAQGRFRGIRPTVGSVLTDKRFLEGYSVINEHNLVVDVAVHSQHLPELLGLAAKYPETPIIINHLGVLPMRHPNQNPPGEISDHDIEPWKEIIAKIAGCETLYMKLGGLGMDLVSAGWKESTNPDSAELARIMKPWYFYCIERFGADRCMLESNFPVDQRSFSYNVHWNAAKRLTENLSPAERYSLFYATAVKAYRL
jgi:predicted TIM-barrel fold metal-dependent hydrolase